ncbi:MAG TPA: long-chain fatty acid--CoA ligase [Dermatophilaceae bacterium]|nr:long-chain fatty acid--CoA ligase [Dermatophilaceae bacterium]
MQETSSPRLVPARPDGNLADLPARNASISPLRVVFARRDGSGWTDVTAAQFLADVERVAKGLIAAGVEVGDRVGLMSRTRYEWSLLDFAIWTAGAVTVPIYETSSASQVEWIASDSGMRAMFVESAAHARTVAEVRDRLTQLEQVWQIDGGGLDDVSAAGEEVPAEQLAQRRRTVTRQDTATIIYTSGTTGRPKGCELSHDNFMSLSENAKPVLTEVLEAPGAGTLLFLPLAHVLARYIQVLAVDAMVRIGHAPDISTLMDDLKSFQPTFVLAVPRVFEKIYNLSDQRSAADGKGRVFRLAARTAIAYSRAMDTGRISLALRAQHVLFERLVYVKVRAAMGGKVTHAVSGGAPLGKRLGHFYRGIGVHILEGYGLTETTAPLCVNLPSLTRIGTVGPPLPGVSLRIADDEEILAKGVGIFQRYRNNPRATMETRDEHGWFHTGDMGSLDDAGCLTITGRKKEILVTAGGKNVAPAPLEDLVRGHPLVSQCVVVGDQRPFIAALLTLDEEMLPTWAQAHGRTGLTAETARDDESVREHLQKAIDRANASVSRAESIRAFRLVSGDFTEASGHLTPSLKVKRDEVTRDFAAEIESMYARVTPSSDATHPAAS